MTMTIAYDHPVKNLIDGLSATGHVTHSTHAKTMVTLHHNGGVNLSHQDILNIWKTRRASAHFDVDKAGAVAQYVAANEYAWACADHFGNETSISIEMANSSGDPKWLVSETTWREAARLTGWLFAHVIHARPTMATLVYHHHWFATACAGPYMDKVYSQVLAATQAAYDGFTASKPTTTHTPTPPEDVMPDFTKPLPKAEADNLAKAVLRADIIPSPDKDPANPAWQLDSYIRELYLQGRETKAEVAALTKAVAALAAKITPAS